MALHKSLLIAALVAGALLVGQAEAQARPAIVISCFVKNCLGCSARNPYVCTSCGAGYRLTAAFGCNSCAVNFEQNLDSPSFQCTACPQGTSSPGGTGLASQCTPITVSSGRRLFAEADEDLWA